MARDAESYERENMLLAMVPELLKANGFTGVVVTRPGGMKVVKARTADGTEVGFWVKQAWQNHSDFAAFQFNLLPKQLPKTSQNFSAFVRSQVGAARDRGAHYLLMLHMPGELIQDNYAVLALDDVPRAYEEQLSAWPKKAMEGGAPVLYFDEERPDADVRRVQLVRRLAVSLQQISGVAATAEGSSARTVWAEVQRRMKQQLFRFRVGEACGWTCAVSGTRVKEVLDAAHLPGKDWRFDNAAEDGIMLRADLHRLLDAGRAEIRSDCFWIHPEARCPEYVALHNRRI
jgi:hypothetical protein